MIYLPLALELANDRVREARREALAHAAGHVASSGNADGPRRPSRARRLVARPVRIVSNASFALSEAACTAARRIEGVSG